jgi:hypothetical protein
MCNLPSFLPSSLRYRAVLNPRCNVLVQFRSYVSRILVFRNRYSSDGWRPSEQECSSAAGTGQLHARAHAQLARLEGAAACKIAVVRCHSQPARARAKGAAAFKIAAVRCHSRPAARGRKKGRLPTRLQRRCRVPSRPASRARTCKRGGRLQKLQPCAAIASRPRARTKRAARQQNCCGALPGPASRY